MVATCSVTIAHDGMQVVVPCVFNGPGSVAALRAVIEAEFRVPARAQHWTVTAAASVGRARSVLADLPGHVTLAEAGLSPEWSRVVVTNSEPHVRIGAAVMGVL